MCCSGPPRPAALRRDRSSAPPPGSVCLQPPPEAVAVGGLKGSLRPEGLGKEVGGAEGDGAAFGSASVSTRFCSGAEKPICFTCRCLCLDHL